MRAGAREGKIMKTKKTILFVSILLLLTQNSWAENLSKNNQSDTVVITATRTAQTVDESLASVSVITSADIEKQNATNLLEVLQSLAGISMTSSGGQGTLTSLFMRGTNSNHLLVLIDGVKAGSVASGTTSFEFIPVEQIDRIEIVRGPRSSLYGSEAIGGVIQIFTKKGDGKLKPSISLAAGSYGTQKAVTTITGGGEDTSYSASLSSYDTEGFNACNGEPLVGGCFADEPDDDPFRYTAGSFSVNHKIDSKTDVGANWLRSDGSVRYDGYYNHTDFVHQVTGLNFNRDLNGKSYLKLQLGQSRDNRENFNDATYLDFTNSKRNSLTIQNDTALDEDAELTLGFDFIEDKLESDTAYNKTSRYNRGVFFQYLDTVEDQNFQGSVRFDNNEQFGSHATGSLAWGKQINKQQRVTVQFGTAFKAPTFADLYYPFASNPNLEPEKSKSLELGYRNQHNVSSWSVNLFQTDIEQLILWDGTLAMPVNIAKARIRGLEFIFRTKIDGWNTQLDVSLLDPENESGANKGKRLIRRATETARLSLSKNFDQVDMGGTLLFSGDRYEDGANSQKMDAYHTIDLHAGYHIDRQWQLKASAKNILDEEYELVKYYNTPGRNYWLSVTYSPN